MLLLLLNSSFIGTPHTGHTSVKHIIKISGDVVQSNVKQQKI